MSFNPRDWVRLAREGFDLLGPLATGDRDAILRELGDVLDVISELDDDVELVQRIGILTAAVLGYGQIIDGIMAGTLQVPGLDQVLRWKESVEADLEPVLARARREIDRIQGILNTDEIAQALRTAEQVHDIGLIVSPAYRNQVADFYDATADLSTSVFGQAQTLSSALGLLQLATNDALRLAGSDQEFGDQVYFRRSLELSRMVERRSREYSRTPGRFWADFHTEFLAPLQRQSAAETAERDERVSGLVEGVNAVESAVTAASKRFDEYREELTPFLERDKLIELDRIRRVFYLEVERPLAGLNTFVNDTWPPVRDQVTSNTERLQLTREELSSVAEIVDDPRNLEQAAQLRQQERISVILERTQETPAEAPGGPPTVQERLSTLLTGLSQE